MRAGAKLAAARQQLGLSIQEVAERIRVRREFLEALEAMNVKLLPGKAYALAFLRSYARALGVDERAIVEQFQEECALSREDAAEADPQPEIQPHQERPWLFAAGVWCWRRAASSAGGRFETPDEAGPAPAVVQTAADVRDRRGRVGALRAGAEARVVEIRALTQAWLEARGPDGTVFLSRTLAAGDVYRPDPSPGWTLHARDGGAFEVLSMAPRPACLAPMARPCWGARSTTSGPWRRRTLGGPRS